MGMQEVHAKVLILRYILGVAHFSASNIALPLEGRLRPKKFSASRRYAVLQKEPRMEKKEEKRCPSKLVAQILQKRFQISE